MKYTDYENNIINKICLDSPGYIKQKLINNIRKEKIGEYNSKDSNIVNLSGLTKEEKIIKCIRKNKKTIQLFDKIEIEKGYRYSILFYCSNINYNDFVEKLRKNAIDINSEYYNEQQKQNEIDDSKLAFYDTEKRLFIKAYKSIEIINKRQLRREYVRYPILFVFHKEMNIFECRFDRLSFNNNNDFYKTTMDARLYQIKGIQQFNCSYVDLETIIKQIVENKKEFIREIIWSFESAKSKGLTLKVGEDGVLPFIGDLEIILANLKQSYNKNSDVLECLAEIDDYIDKTKRFANERFRILSLVKNESSEFEKSIDFKILFEYSNNAFDLINIYDNEINDMERINYVVEFIGKSANKNGKM